MISDDLVQEASAALNKVVSENKKKANWTSRKGQPEDEPSLTREMLNPFKNSDDQRSMVIGALREWRAQKGITDGDMRQLAARLVGLGPLDPLVHDPTVISINVQAHDNVLVNRAGVWVKSDVRWESTDHLRAYAIDMASVSGLSINDDRMVVQQAFRDPPGRIQIDATRRGDAGVTIAIRLGRKTSITLSQMVSNGSCSPEMADFMREIAQRNAGVLIVGMPGTGKTTLLEALMDFWPMVPVVGLDDHSEFDPKHPLCAVYDASAEGLSEALTHALRKNITRIAVAELRGNEAAEMLRYSNSMTVWTTLHGSVDNAVTRLMSLAQGAPNSPFSRLSDAMMRKIIASSFPIVIECDVVIVGGQSTFFISRIARMDESGEPSNIYLARMDGPRLLGFTEASTPANLLQQFMRRVWGGVEMPGLDIIGNVAKRFPDIALAVLSQILRIRRDPSTESLLRSINNIPAIRDRYKKLQDDYTRKIQEALRARLWQTVVSLYDAIEADKVLSVLSGGRLAAEMSRDEAQRRARLVREADEIITLSRIRPVQMALMGLLGRVRAEPSVYPPDMEARVAQALGMTEEAR